MANGVVYVVETAGAVVRRFAFPGGTITAFAGTTANSGFSGDGGAATSAKLNGPKSVAVDPVSGGVYVGDTSNNRVRFVFSNGTISTFAGNGNAAYTGACGGVGHRDNVVWVLPPQ